MGLFAKIFKKNNTTIPVISNYEQAVKLLGEDVAGDIYRQIDERVQDLHKRGIRRMYCQECDGNVEIM